MELTYVGHAAARITTATGDVVLIDPWLTDNPHTELTPAAFETVDEILVTHAAFDHLGDAPAVAQAHDAEIVCDSATAMKLEEDGVPERLIRPYIWGPEYAPPVADGEWSVRILEAHHQSAVPELNLVGEALAYLVHADGERIYHMGDTSVSRDFELYGDLYDPTVVLVPVGQAIDQFVELHPDEAALVTEWLDPDVAVPIHYQPGSSNPDRYVEACEQRELDVTVRQLAPGERLSRSGNG